MTAPAKGAPHADLPAHRPARTAGGKACEPRLETNVFTERAFRAVARLTPRPDVVVITGDLTECGLDAEYANLSHLLRKFLPMPVFVIPGNHDRRERSAREVEAFAGRHHRSTLRAVYG